jgi:hypothetical protein
MWGDWREFASAKHGENETTSTDRGWIEPTHLKAKKFQKERMSPRTVSILNKGGSLVATHGEEFARSRAVVQDTPKKKRTRGI